MAAKISPAAKTLAVVVAADNDATVFGVPDEDLGRFLGVEEPEEDACALPALLVLDFSLSS